MTTSSAQVDFLRYALEIGALELLPNLRKLKSGRMSPYFFNSGLFTNGKSLCELAFAYAAIVSMIREECENNVDVLFGPAYKGIPLAATIALTCATEFEDVEFSFNRKETKDHGEGGLIVGANCRNKDVLIIDDVMTTGTSIIEAKEIIEAAGGNVTGALIGFDRQERGIDTELSAVQAFEQKYQIPVWSSVGLKDLIYTLEQYPELDPNNVLPQIRDYQAEFGAA